MSTTDIIKRDGAMQSHIINMRCFTLALYLAALVLPFATFAGAAGSEHQVEISFQTKLLPDQSITDDYLAKRWHEPFMVQRLTERTYFIMVDTYNSTIYVGDKGVLLIDPMADGRAGKLLEALATITDLPITAMIYSHSHLDHIGDAQIVFDLGQNAGVAMRVIATDKTVDDIERYAKSVPAVSEIVATPRGTIRFEDLTIDVITPRDHGHSEDSSIFFLTSEKVAHYADAVEIGLPFFYFNLGKDMKAVEDTISQFMNMDWVFYNGGHGAVGKKHDLALQLEYIADVRNAVLEAFDEYPMADFFDPNDHSFAQVAKWLDAGSAYVKKKLAPKYGHYGEFEYFVYGHTYRIASDFVFHGMNHLK